LQPIIFVENSGGISCKLTGKGSKLKVHKEEWLFMQARCVGDLQIRDMLKNLMHSLLQRESRFFADQKE